jgi:hypothetical protein
MTSSIMHSCDESDDSLRITSVEVEVQKTVSSCDGFSYYYWFSDIAINSACAV